MRRNEYLGDKMNDSVKLICLDCGQANRVPAGMARAKPICGTCGQPLVDGKPHQVDFRTLQKAIRLDDLPIMVDFWAPWCGPCRMMAPEFAKAAETMRGRVRFMKIDTQQFPEASATFRIQGIPALILFRNGRELDRLVGARPASGIAAFAARGLPQSA
jgi:thioredoxin 2